MITIIRSIPSSIQMISILGISKATGFTFTTGIIIDGTEVVLATGLLITESVAAVTDK
jgi:hypothetical protein